MDFLADSNVCGQHLLRLVSRGSAVAAEMLRLSKAVPSVFLLEDFSDGTEKGHDRAAHVGTVSEIDRKYGPIIFDFRYLKNQDLYEKKIEDSNELLELDEEFRENHEPMLERFYKLFEGVYKYISDFLKFLTDLSDGIYIQQTFEGVLNNTDGRQLLSEALYLYGVVLILLDTKIPGYVRERMIISYYRYKGFSEIPNIDEVCKLCRSTGFTGNWNAQRPQNYPEDYFSRFSVPRSVVRMLLGRLRSEDIYSQTTYYPDPDHRSAALSNQAAMIYVILFFAPDTLKNENAVMREIVDKHFPDNWVISYYMGYTVDLSLVWGSEYPAARNALGNTITPDNLSYLYGRYNELLFEANKDVEKLLVEGTLTEEYVLDNIPKMMSVIRKANVTIRWLILHIIPRNPKMAELVNGFRTETILTAEPKDVLLLLLNESQFEFILKNMLEVLLGAKEEKWEECKKKGCERMNQLSQYFSGEQVLARDEKHDQLSSWFKDLSSKIETLDYHDSVLAGRKIYQLIQALEQVEPYSQIETNLLVKQFLHTTRELLRRMIRYVNIKDEVVITIAQVSDVSYAWEEMRSYVPEMQRRIKNDPGSVVMFRSMFLKLASVLELPLVRIIQADSPDLESVSQYYSTVLVNFVRQVMEIIPQSMFALLKDIITLQTTKMQEIPHRLNRAELRDFAQLGQRYELANITHAVGKFTEGMLAMETTLMGVIEVDPKRLLEDGIRKELVRQICGAMDSELRFQETAVTSISNDKKVPLSHTNAQADDFEQRLSRVKQQLQGMRRSFEYIQDFINMYGLKIWQEEFCRIVAYNVEQECNLFLKTKVYDYMSKYQSDVVRIPTPRPQPGDKAVTFMGRLARALLNLTDPTTTVYVYQNSGWYDLAGREVVGIRSFGILFESVGVFGLAGLDKLLSFMIVSDLQRAVQGYQRVTGTSKQDIANRNKQWAEQNRQLGPSCALVVNPSKVYGSLIAANQQLLTYIGSIIFQVGQAQLLRWHIGNELNFSAKLDSYHLTCALKAANEAMVRDAKLHYENPQQYNYPDADSPLMVELVNYLDTCGMAAPFAKIYITSDPLPYISLIMFLYVIDQLSKMTFDRAFDTLISQTASKTRSSGSLDGYPFVTGVLTVLRQFHSSHTDRFYRLCGQYIRSYVSDVRISQKDVMKGMIPSLPNEVVTLLYFLDLLCKVGDVPRRKIESFVPPYLFNVYDLK